MINIKKIIFRVIITAAITLFLLYQGFSMPCPIRVVFKIPCPTCGMTRALVCLLKFDFRLSLYYNPLTIPFCLLMLFAIFKDSLKVNKRTANIILITCAVIIFVVYLIRLWNNKLM